LNKGFLEVFYLGDYANVTDYTNIIMSSSAIPVIFPPIDWNGHT